MSTTKTIKKKSKWLLGKRQTIRRRRAAAQRGTKRTPSKRLRAPALPGWSDLAGTNEKRRAASRGTYLERVSTARFALLILALAAAFTLYVGHVHATQALLAELQQTRRQNLRLHLKHDRLKGAYDRGTGPAVIYERSAKLGLEEGYTYGPTITMGD